MFHKNRGPNTSHLVDNNDDPMRIWFSGKSPFQKNNKSSLFKVVADFPHFSCNLWISHLDLIYFAITKLWSQQIRYTEVSQYIVQCSYTQHPSSMLLIPSTLPRWLHVDFIKQNRTVDILLKLFSFTPLYIHLTTDAF